MLNCPVGTTAIIQFRLDNLFFKRLFDEQWQGANLMGLAENFISEGPDRLGIARLGTLCSFFDSEPSRLFRRICVSRLGFRSRDHSQRAHDYGANCEQGNNRYDYYLLSDHDSL